MKKLKRTELINCNINLVHYILKTKFSWTEGFKYRKNVNGTNVFTYEDLVQEGIIGLIKAVDSYKRRKGAFSTYAIACIIRRITWALMEKGFGMIRLPQSIYVAKKKIDEICENKRITYSDLFEQKKISKAMYNALLCILNYKNYETIESGKENENAELIVESSVRTSLFHKEEKEYAAKFLWIATNIAFKKNMI